MSLQAVCVGKLFNLKITITAELFGGGWNKNSVVFAQVSPFKNGRNYLNGLETETLAK